ncbi:hypothetical protein [Seonamhaeicola aphaedonensis]|uniref:Uncharacterized protein n=1 Tax=Seonamhaeicola aphaedonensis TaxID=1461338 RepID=A0A3D9HJH9_9FLAO|nr:hypothetical protein [Seonamhaeicola aphaedonensis]RED49618.1 hypothetical protein DFQ02_102397 [Seonamhaeicola aphaedonensis]
MKYLNYFLIVIGATIALYANGIKEQNQYILIAGIVLLMVGIYRLSRTIPSKIDNDNELNADE